MRKVKRNKRILELCYVQLGLFLFLLAGVLLYFGKVFQVQEKAGLTLRMLLVTVALVGCSVSLALKDYIKGVIQSAAIDVAGVHNKKSLEKKLAQIQEQDDTLDVGILMFDLNNLKEINDTYGHDEGDRFIKTFAAFLTRILTENSFLARYGGDEFLIVQEHTTPKEMEEIEQKLQAIVDTYNLQATHPISYAVGYEVSYRNHYYLIPDLMKIADSKMYQDKAYKKKNQKRWGMSAEIPEGGIAQSVSAELLSERLYTMLTNGEKEKTYAFLMTDVREFHLINDYWGFDTGNQVLQFVLERMRLLEGNTFVYRFHSDIFVSVIDTKGKNEAELKEQIASYNRKIAKEILEAYPVQYFSLRTGIYYDIHQEENPDRIVSHANTARRIAKEDPLGICVYSGKIEEGELRKADVLHSFRGALEREEFKIYFQPKVSGTDESIRSAEVLVRWQREDGQIWTPDRFLPVLEETGKIETLDFYVYEMAFQWLEAQKEKGEPQIYLSLNVSPAHFRDVEGFTRQLLELIGKYQIDSRYLIFEITESAYIHNIDAVNRMIATLHGEQIRISMDDFGSGYSSLNTLKDITFDEVKIDKRFLGDSLTENGRIVLQEIFRLLKRTRKTIVCEGVETRGVADFLIQEGCDELQGYYYYRPMDQESFETVMKEQDRKDRNIVS